MADSRFKTQHAELMAELFNFAPTAGWVTSKNRNLGCGGVDDDAAALASMGSSTVGAPLRGVGCVTDDAVSLVLLRACSRSPTTVSEQEFTQTLTPLHHSLITPSLPTAALSTPQLIECVELQRPSRKGQGASEGRAPRARELCSRSCRMLQFRCRRCFGRLEFSLRYSTLTTTWNTRAHTGTQRTSVVTDTVCTCDLLSHFVTA